MCIRDRHELGVCRGWSAEVGVNGPQLFRVQAIVKAVFQALQGRPLIGPLVGFEVGCGRRHPSFPYDKQRRGSAAVSASSGHRDQNSAHDEAPQMCIRDRHRNKIVILKDKPDVTSAEDGKLFILEFR